MEKKKVNMTPNGVGAKLTEEQLKNYLDQAGAQVRQLAVENQKLKEQLQGIQRNEFYVVLDWLWKIINSDNQLIEPLFKRECAKRFQEMMTPVQQTEEQPKPEAKEE